jgi:muramoyltetrapeptide carboxypeptidase
MTRLQLFSPSGRVPDAATLRRAERRLRDMGFQVERDRAALAGSQRFAGDDGVRLDALHRVADAAPPVALATRGGYGLTRLLDAIDWARVSASAERGTRWVGHSDFTAFQLGLLAHARAASGALSWAGPMACSDFGHAEPPAGEDGVVDEITRDCFVEAMAGLLEAVGFRTEAGFDGLQVRGRLWGGNLCMVTSLLGTPHWPGRRVRGGILFLEDVNEHPYRTERSLLQLHQAGVLDAQSAIVLGHFTGFQRLPADRGYTLRSVVRHLRSLTRTPILTGLPFGHVATKVCLPVGARAELVVDGREVFLAWGHAAG